MEKEKNLTGRNVVMGLQHTFVMFGATVLVPIITGLDVGVALCMAGIGTIIFHLCTRGKMPTFLGSSFAFIAALHPDCNDSRRYPAHIVNSCRFAGGTQP